MTEPGTSNGLRLGANVALFGMGVAAYVGVPVWYIPASDAVRLVLVNAFVAVAGVLLVGLRGVAPLELVVAPGWVRRNAEKIAILAAVTALHLPFWVLPIPTEGDDQSHAGPSAYFLARTFSSEQLRILQVAGWLALGTLAFLVLLASNRRRGLPSLELTSRRACFVALGVTALAANAYALALLGSGVLARAGMWQTFLRYPPVAKLLLVPAYALFGIHEAVPRILQFGFVVAAAEIASRWVGGDDRPARAAIFGLFLLWPSFFHFSNTSLLEPGVVFFTLAVPAALWIELGKGRRWGLGAALIGLQAGLLYKQLLVPAAIFLGLCWLIPAVRRRVPLRDALCLGGVAASAAPFVAFGMLTQVRPYSSDPASFGSLENLALLATTNGPAAVVFVAAGLGVGLYRRRTFTLGWVAFALAYHLWLSSTGANAFIRHAQPIHLAAFLAGAVALAEARALSRGRPVLVALLGVAVVAIAADFVYRTTFEPGPVQRRNLTNLHAHMQPYDELARYLAERSRDDGTDTPLRIYAPMESEPSHFYLAKHGLARRVLWDRSLPPEPQYREAAVLAHCREAGLTHVVLIDTVHAALIAEIRASPAFTPIASFESHGLRAELFAVAAPLP